MKNQYFGDKNDFYKYDLALNMTEACGLRTFTFLVMLTPDDGRGDGSLTSYDCGARSAKLHQFLQDCVQNGRRRVEELTGFLDLQQISHTTFLGDVSAAVRPEYFASIGCDKLQSALVFLDPDNGLEVKSTRRGNLHKFVRYDEVRSLYERMGDDSLLMVYQHIPRIERIRFFSLIAQRLHERVDPLGCACYSPDNQVAFFFITKDQGQKKCVREVLPAYAARVGAAHCVVDLL
ncbi:MAG TPA: hypothetical protein VGM19_09755 [Armatimonadota bacterium]|jgi:hypothetical protein